MKLSNWILRVSLIAMVILSFVFTSLIWRNPSRQERRNTSNVQVTTENDPNVKKLEGTIYLPNQVYYTHGGQKQLLMEANANMSRQVRQTMADWHMTKIKTIGKVSSTNYDNYLQQDDSLQLIYQDVMSFKQFEQWYFNKQPNLKSSDFHFNRILLNLETGANRLTFINDATRTVYEAKLTNVTTGQLENLVKKRSTKAFPIEEKRLSGNEVAFFTQPIKLQPYAYLMDQQSANYYVSLLMPSKTASNVDAREIGDSTLYTAGSTRRMTADSTTGAIEFENYAAAFPNNGLANFFHATFKGLSALQMTNLSSMRYFQYDASRGSVIYKTYAQGFPIFKADQKGDVRVRYTQTSEEINFSNTNLTVPIPTNQPAQTLPATATIVDQLVAAGYRASQITDILIGYQWIGSSNDQQVVDLQPTYYVEMKGEYRDYQSWLNHSSASSASAASSQTATPSNDATAGSSSDSGASQ
ncbi:hypothetical protein FEZ34_07400 [Lacticaseibacillus casei]|uniref:YycH family regulatory protein n=1 Tax=Lacticaseibacillus casei TaxID=1582 RepID=UPI001108D84C|nr:two-component system activity regulator YycH [Lacticaseibacillus casei]TLQ50832.1 hypothetical protein FEZ34_07400 [Lacticaseibacillus casei]